MQVDLDEKSSTCQGGLYIVKMHMPNLIITNYSEIRHMNLIIILYYMKITKVTINIIILNKKNVDFKNCSVF